MDFLQFGEVTRPDVFDPGCDVDRRTEEENEDFFSDQVASDHGIDRGDHDKDIKPKVGQVECSAEAVFSWLGVAPIRLMCLLCAFFEECSGGKNCQQREQERPGI